MSSSESDIEELQVTPDILEDDENVTLEVLPLRSQKHYWRAYKIFNNWRLDKNLEISLDTMLTYFEEISTYYKPPTLWSKYSMLRTTIENKHRINIEEYRDLINFLKLKSKGYTPKKSKVLSIEHMKTFLRDAPDETYLSVKVALIFGICGACRHGELINISINDIKDMGEVFKIILNSTKKTRSRQFIIDGDHLQLVRRYISARPRNGCTDRFFLTYKDGKCLNKPIGKNRIGKMPSEIAQFLGLPDAEMYTGHAFRSSANICAREGIQLDDLKKFGEWKTEVAEGYVSQAKSYKRKISKTTSNVNAKMSNDIGAAEMEPKPKKSKSEIDKIVSLYRRIFQVPSATSGRLILTKNKGFIAQCGWSQRNLEKRTKQKCIQEFTFNSDLQRLSKGFPVDVTTELLTTYSKDEKFKAVLRDVTVDGKSKQFIEIWDSQHLYKSYDLSAFDVHGDVYTDATFSGFDLSPDNTRLVYVAEKKYKCEPFYKQKPKRKPKTNETNDDDEPSRGTEYVYKPDWGEQLVGKHRSVIVVLNFEQDTIEPVTSVPDDYFPSQVLWSSDGEDIVGVAYKLTTFYLGLYACTNRQSYIFYVRGTEFHKVTADGLCCDSPRFNSKRNILLWLERDISPSHHNVQRLMYLKWGSGETPFTLVELIKTFKKMSDGKKFFGLYNYTLPKNCWGDNDNYVLISTPQRSSIKSYMIDFSTKEMVEINVGKDSLVVSDVKENYILLYKLSLTKPPQYCITKIDSEAIYGKFKITECSDAFNVSFNERVIYQQSEFAYTNDDPVKDFNYTLFGEPDGELHSIPLIVAIHGGPHSSYCNMFYADYALFVQLGFQVLQINYRGSTGMGGDNVDYLLGKVGDVDVRDCITAIDEVLKNNPHIDPKRINLYGGSHGGFLGAHLSGQYPDKFRSVILLNPVIDIASMYTTTDIPDWCRAESGIPILKKLPEPEDEINYNELLKIMLDHSPIIHVDKVKAPTLIALGSKDLRVPSSQGKLWYKRLVNNNVKAKLFMYEDNHSLRKDEVEIDNVINCALWLMEHNDLS